MSKAVRYGFNTKIVPLKAPVDSAATAYATGWVDLKNAEWARFFLFFGVITATSADQNITVTMECATAAASGSEVQLTFDYRKSGAVATDSWGAITAVSTASTGISVDTTAEDNKMYAIDINPAKLDGALADGRFVRLVMTPDAGGTVTLNAAWAEIEPGYPQLSQLSAS